MLNSRTRNHCFIHKRITVTRYTSLFDSTLYNYCSMIPMKLFICMKQPVESIPNNHCQKVVSGFFFQQVHHMTCLCNSSRSSDQWRRICFMFFMFQQKFRSKEKYNPRDTIHVCYLLANCFI